MPIEIPQNYTDVIHSLKRKILQARLQAVLTANAQMLAIYWEIGDTILKQKEIEGWGTKVIKKISQDLKTEFSNMKGFSERNLIYMQTFATAYPNFLIAQAGPAQLENGVDEQNIITQEEPAQLKRRDSYDHDALLGLLAKLSWYHITTLLDKVKDEGKRYFYILSTIQNGWSRDVMVHQIESGLDKRQGNITNNFSQTIPPDKSELVQQVFKDPYKFDFLSLGQQLKERDLEDALTNQITKFLLELGQWFAFMGRQYKMQLGMKEYFFDLLFYHTRLKRYVVIDLKIDEFKPEYKGKMEFYLTLADEQLKTAGDDPSIGLILCKTKDGLVAEYALRDSNKPIGIAEYKYNEMLPENFMGELPTIEDLETFFHSQQ